MAMKKQRAVPLEADPSFDPTQPDHIVLALTRRGDDYEVAVGTSQFTAYTDLPRRQEDGTVRLERLGLVGSRTTWANTGMVVPRGANLEETLGALAAALHDGLCTTCAESGTWVVVPMSMDPLF